MSEILFSLLKQTFIRRTYRQKIPCSSYPPAYLQIAPGLIFHTYNNTRHFYKRSHKQHSNLICSSYELHSKEKNDKVKEEYFTTVFWHLFLIWLIIPGISPVPSSLEIKNIQSHIRHTRISGNKKGENTLTGINFNSNPSKSLMFSFFFCVFFYQPRAPVL